MSEQKPREFWASGKYSFTSKDKLEKFLEGWPEGEPRNDVRNLYCHTIEKSAYDRLKAQYDELISYMPKVPTQSYEKELAQKYLKLSEHAEKLAEALLMALQYCEPRMIELLHPHYQEYRKEFPK